VEPVFGNLKFNFGFTRFSLRGLAKVRGEFLLICIAHNLKKLAQWPGYYRTPAAFPAAVRVIRACLHRYLTVFQALETKIGSQPLGPESINPKIDLWDNLRIPDGALNWLFNSPSVFAQ
jgi:hypothetical protein